ncbi:MAG: UvrB/UvrC motif-containing protein [Planctomycetota bacterium]|nr:UvrB/UvrC motif-containing protein [Planctomycetota bacterium]MDA1140219.1 UvrB/UvrC motif-containing protein [Planctomycetota bacterium]
MKCDQCDKNATVHITENLENKEKRREVHLCEECAREQGVLQQPSLPQMLGGMLAGGPEAAITTPDIACTKCGMTYSEFRSSGRLGCSDCYKPFKRPLIPFLEKVHGSTRHTGKAPSHMGRSMAVEQRIAVLQREMDKAVEDEDFERAADLRDKIQELKEKRDGTG